MDADRIELEIVVHAMKDDINPDDSYSELYILDLETGKAKCRGDKLLRKEGRSEMVALGDVIYIIGNSRGDGDDDDGDKDGDGNKDKDDVGAEKDDGCKAVFCIDLSNIFGGWERLQNFRSCSGTPDCIAFKGKIYLFGGPILDMERKLLTFAPGEVYDPQRGNWDDLPLPLPEKVSWAKYVSIPPILDHANDRLLVHFKHINFLYAYYPDQLKWQPIFPLPSCMWAPRSAVVDDMIIFNDPETDEHFTAFDLRDGRWCSVSVSVKVADFNSNLLWGDFDAFIPLHPPGTFCLAVQYSVHPCDTHLTFLKLSVEVPSSRDPCITLLSISDVGIPGSYSIYNYLPVVGRKTCLEAETLESLTDLRH